ncbi:hypothetical protein QQ045_011784 [Rhodiola kirilowii]
MGPRLEVTGLLEGGEKPADILVPAWDDEMQHGPCLTSVVVNRLRLLNRTRKKPGICNGTLNFKGEEIQILKSPNPSFTATRIDRLILASTPDYKSSSICVMLIWMEGSAILICSSGMPECKLGLNDSVLLEAKDRSTKGKAIDLDYIKFHQCNTIWHGVIGLTSMSASSTNTGLDGNITQFIYV